MNQMGNFVKQAKKMQEKMEQLEKELAESLIEIEAAGGAVIIKISGDVMLNAIKINPDVIDKNDAEGLEDLILTAVNHAIKEAKAFSDEKTKSVTAGLKMPGGFNF